jgi:glycosyltransferase involved in cell wall biosynthesis
MADNQPLVSIILPVRDGESSIAATLESAVGQTYGNTEIIVVDDGSRDGTRAIVEAWVARDPRIRLIAQVNRGVAAARNRAVEAARGELIAPLDADDLWDPTKIARQVRRMLEAWRRHRAGLLLVGDDRRRRHAARFVTGLAHRRAGCRHAGAGELHRQRQRAACTGVRFSRRWADTI